MITIDITPKKNTNLTQGVSKDNHYFGCKSQREKIMFDNNKIVIEGHRSNNIDVNNAFSTVRSTYYMSILKTFIYYLANYGAFNINKIVFDVDNGKNETLKIEKDKFNDSFCKPINFVFPKEKLEEIFEIENPQNAFFTALVYQVYAVEVNNIFEKFANSWRCFNCIYNRVNENIKDKDGITSVLNEIEDDSSPLLEDTINDSWKFMQHLKDSRLINWFNRETKKKGNVDSLVNILGINRYQDKALIERLQKVAKEIFDKIEKEVALIKERKGNVEGIVTPKDQRDKYKNIQKLKGKTSYKFDYLLITISYTMYLRNKYFHGEYGYPQILFKNNDRLDELNATAAILQKLNWVLLEKYYSKLYETNF